MSVGDIIALFEMNRMHRFLFYCVNMPRYLLGMDIVVWKCMMGCKTVKGFKKAIIHLGEGE